MAGDADQAVVALKPKKRPYKPKVRTGCITCKIRRIKCDETKPNCIRCTSTGRKCDGYEIPRQFLFEICTDERERRSFEYFRQRTAREISSFNERFFWDRLVLQASYSQEAVRHALVAIGSFHEGLENSNSGNGSSVELYKYALEQQSMAINSLTKAPRPLTVEEVLMACVLFTWFENAQCNFDAAVTHMQSGVKILADWRAEQLSRSGRSRSAVIEEDLAYILDSLKFLASAMVAPIVATTQEKEGVSYTSSLPDAFEDISEAHFYFYQLIHWACQKFDGHEKYDLDVETDLQSNVVPKIVIVFEEWFRLLVDYMQRTPDGRCASHTPGEPCILNLGLLHLQIQYVAAMTMVKCIPFATEIAFDRQSHHFEDIVTYASAFHAEKMSLEAVGVTEIKHNCVGFDLCIIPPLFLTASRCRDPQIRRSAIALLRNIRRWEGIWASDVAACLSEALMAHEEEGLIKPFSSLDVPDSRRLHLVNSSWFSYSEETKRLELSFDTINPEWLKLQCRRSGKDSVTDGFETIWYNRRGEKTNLSEDSFPRDVPGLFPQLAKSNTCLWQMLDSGAAARYLGRFSSNHIFSAHSRKSSLHGDFVTLSGEFTQYLASERQSERPL